MASCQASDQGKPKNEQAFKEAPNGNSNLVLASNQKFSINAPPGTVENRVFIGGNYALMPILREIAKAVSSAGFQPIIAYDFDIPRELTRDYSLRLLYQCRYAIFELTIPDGHLVELARGTMSNQIQILQLYMAMDARKKPPKTVSTMVWQSKPPPEGYVSMIELRWIVQNFLKPGFIDNEPQPNDDDFDYYELSEQEAEAQAEQEEQEPEDARES